MLRGKKRARKRTRERDADGLGCCEAPDATLRKIRRRASLAVGATRCLYRAGEHRVLELLRNLPTGIDRAVVVYDHLAKKVSKACTIS